MYDEYEDGDEGGSSIGRKIALGIGVVAIAAAGFFAFNAVTGGDDDDEVAGGGTAASTVAPSDTSVTSTEAGGSLATATTATTASTETTEGTTAAPRTTAESATSTAVTSTTTAPTAPPTTVPPTYPTRSNGEPEWVVVIYDTDSITLKGVVPDEASKQELQEIASLYARNDQQRATINNVLTTNPAMPETVGVRVVELTSTRFPEGKSDITPEHALEFDRVVTAMQTFPNLTALIIGHADQRGDEVANYVLSSKRADATLAYMISRGIDPTRLQATAVGEEELLSLDDDAAALALNRRTEFVIYGLLQAL